MLDTKPETGAVPTSSGSNRFANKRMLIICATIAAVFVLVVAFRVVSMALA